MDGPGNLTLSPEERELRYLFRLVFQFLDLSRDLDRNKDDAAFRQTAGNRITYVFDASVFEILINPRDTRGRATSLHTGQWLLADKPRQGWRSYVAQTALSTLEYLAGGELPGQRGRQIYMTEWHRWELARRIQNLHTPLLNRLRTAGAPEIVNRFDPVKNALKYFDDHGGESPRKLDPELEFDLKQLQKLKASKKDRRAFLATRLFVKILADDTKVSPATQLRRLVTPPLRNSLATLHLSFAPDPADHARIAEDARQWFRALENECKIRGIRVTSKLDREDEETSLAAEDASEKVRTSGALWDDARSLAFVRWAASRVAPSERLVFVTGDPVMFDAYRRWYAELDPSQPAYLEPFVLRRITQYAPIFNLVDSKRIYDERFRDLFRDLDQTLEVMLLPLNLARMRPTSVDERVLARMRELTALANVDKAWNDPLYSPLVNALKRNVAPHRAALDDLVGRWRELERSALGQAHDQVQKLVREHDRIFAGVPDAAVGLEAQELLQRYVSHLVHKILDGTQKIWLPLAREFVEDWRPAKPTGLTRAPIALHLRFQIGSEPVPFGKWLDQRIQPEGHPSGDGFEGPLVSRETWPELYRRPEVTFTIAAILAMTCEDWSNAEHFSSIALQVGGSPAPGTAPRTEDWAEIFYVAALAKRFRIGEIGPPLTSDACSRIDRAYDAAKSLLDECLAYHEHNDTGHPHKLRILRTLSERAALHLFYSESFNPSMRFAAHERAQSLAAHARPHGKSALSPNAGIQDLGREESARRSLQLAEADLKRCIEVDRSLGSNFDADRAAFRMKLQRQYFTNIASAGVTRWLWDDMESGDSQLSPLNPEAVAMVRTLLDRHGDKAHPVMRAEALTFLALAGDQDKHSQLLKAPSGRAVLNLDTAIIETIKRRVSAASIGASFRPAAALSPDAP